MAQVQRDGVSQLANVENARLWVDFERSRFGTRFDLTAANLRVGLQAQGNVGSDGTFSNPSQYLDGNNMVVQGVMVMARWARCLPAIPSSRGWTPTPWPAA